MKYRLRKKKWKQHCMNQNNANDFIIYQTISLREMLNRMRFDRCLDRFERDYLGE